MRSVTWVQSKSHHFVNTADTFRERSHTHKSMQHVGPTGIFKQELWILCHSLASNVLVLVGRQLLLLESFLPFALSMDNASLDF